MRIVTTTTVFPRGYAAEDAVDRLAGIGFDGLDMGLDYWNYSPDTPFMGDGYLDWAKSLRQRAERLGAPYTHAHAPGGADSGELITRAIRAAQALGVKYMVVHPMYRYADGREIDDAEDFVRMNARELYPHVEEAEKRGVVLLAENLLDGAVSDPRAVCALVKEVGSPFFGWCYDTGHAHCRGFGPEALDGLPAPLSLHLQDNMGESDDHYIPGEGTIDWKKLIGKLREIGYSGDCVLEAHEQCKRAPDGERDAVLRRLLDSGRALRELFERRD